MKNSEIYEFENFRLEAEKPALWFEGELVPLKLKALDTLVALVRRDGEIVSKDELMDEIWGNSFVEENSLSRNVYEIRKTLKEISGKNFIETVPRRGYRFAVEIHKSKNGSNKFAVERQALDEALEKSLIEESDDIQNRTVFEHEAAAVESENSIIKRLFSVRWHLAALFCALFVTGFYLLWKNEGEAGFSSVPLSQRNINNVAILPFKPISETEESKILSLSITDALISRLGKLNRFVVRPLSSVDKYLESGKDSLEFGKELNVDAVLTGTLINTENRYRINIRFFDIRDGAQIWTETFDMSETDILQIQDIMSAKIAENLLSDLNGEEKTLLEKKPTDNAAAYKLYLQGRYILNRRESESRQKNFTHLFEQAITLDPNFALAHLGMADAYAFTYETERAEDALDKAILLDPTLAEAHATRGFIRMFHYWDWAGAETSFQRATELAPNDAKSHHWYGVYFSITGQIEKALAEMEKAHELDPTSLAIMSDIGQLYYFAREYDRADSQLEEVLDIDPTFLNANAYRYRVNLVKGDKKGILEKYTKAALLTPDEVNEVSRIASSGESDWNIKYDLKRLGCDKSDRIASLHCAENFVLLGEKNKALDHLEHSLKNRHFLIPFIKIDPIWDDIRGDKRFEKIASQINYQNNLIYRNSY